MNNYSQITITKQVVNPLTGEFEDAYFHNKQKSKTKIGWSRVYAKNYDEICLLMKTNLELSILIAVKDMFSSSKVEIGINQTHLAKKLKISARTVRSVFKRLTDNDFIKRLDNGNYRLNPFIYLPLNSDAETLQLEWTALSKDEA
jgi:predicted transcriptional regulator